MAELFLLIWKNENNYQHNKNVDNFLEVDSVAHQAGPAATTTTVLSMADFVYYFLKQIVYFRYFHVHLL